MCISSIKWKKGTLHISDLEKFLAAKLYVETPSLSPQFEISIEPGADVSASELIRSLYTELKGLSTFNSKRGIQKWIFNLFIDYDAEGFSFHNVKKSTEHS